MFGNDSSRSSVWSNDIKSSYESYIAQVSILLVRNYLILLNVVNVIVTGVLQVPNIYVLFIFRLFQGVLVGNYMTLITEYIG
jgi:hypothetical protein